MEINKSLYTLQAPERLASGIRMAVWMESECVCVACTSTWKWEIIARARWRKGREDKLFHSLTFLPVPRCFSYVRVQSLCLRDSYSTCFPENSWKHAHVLFSLIPDCVNNTACKHNDESVTYWSPWLHTGRNAERVHLMSLVLNAPCDGTVIWQGKEEQG